MVNLVITYKSPESFGVMGKTTDGRAATCSFDYRIVAKDNTKQNARMELVEIPDPVYMPRKD